MFPEFSEQQWLDRLRMDNEKALNYFIVLYSPALKSMVEKMVDNTAEAEDIVIETFTVLWRRRKTITCLRHLWNFLRQVAQQRAIDYLRKQQRRKIPEQEWRRAWLDQEAVAEADMQRASALEECNRLAKGLPTVSQRMYRLHVEQGLTEEEIAEKTSKSPFTVRNQLISARKKLVDLFILKRR